jgi:hypothetical protein
MIGVEYLFTFSPGVSKTRTARPSGSTDRRKEDPDLADEAAAVAVSSFSSKRVLIRFSPG